MKLILLIIFPAICFAQTTYYVDTNGTDGAGINGSISSPWKTLSYAATRVTTAGDTIYINPGQHVDTSRVDLSIGVSIIGNDSTSCINTTYSYGSTDADEYGYISLKSNSSGTNGNQILRDFKLTGTDTIAAWGITIYRRSNVTVTRLIIKNFRYRGIVFATDCCPVSTYETDNEFSYSTVSNCAGGHTSGGGGGIENLLVLGQDSMTIHHNTFNSTDRISGNNGGAIRLSRCRGLKIYNNISYRPLVETNYSIHIEGYNGSNGGIEIYNNTFYNGDGAVDCAGMEGAFEAGYGYSYSIHNNIMVGSGYTYSYGGVGAVTIEDNNIYDVYVRYNKFIGFPTCLSITGKARVGGSSLGRIYFQYNICENLGFVEPTKNGSAISINSWTGNPSIIDSVFIDNNTIIANPISRMRGIDMGGNDSVGTTISNIYVRNNIVTDCIYTTYSSWCYIDSIYAGVIIDNIYIQNNVLYGNKLDNEVAHSTNITHYTESGNIKSDPLFWNKALWKLMLQEESPCINAGLSFGQTMDYAGNPIYGIPDIGALERQPYLRLWRVVMQPVEGDYYITTTGNDDSSGTSVEKAWRTLSKANNTLIAGDTVIIYAGIYGGNINPVNSGTYSNRIVYMNHGTDLVMVTGDATYGNGNSLNISTNYITVRGITFIDSARTANEYDWYWGEVSGDSCILDRVRMMDDQDTTAYFSGGKGGRLLAVSGEYFTAKNCYFRGGYSGVVIDGSTPRYYNFDTDTLTNTGYISLTLGGGGATEGTYHAGIVQNCVLDTCGEDNIQLQNNGTPSELCNSGIIIKNNYMAHARENCIDIKATGPTICIEDNTLVLSCGNDTNEGGGGAPNDDGGAGIELGYGDYSESVITRFNIILSNHSGSKLYAGGHFFNNTVGANNNSYRGTKDTTDGILFSGIVTDNAYESGLYKSIMNNIFFSHSYWSDGQEVKLHKAGGGNFYLDYNLYWQKNDSAKFTTNIFGTATPVTLSGIGSWRTYLESSDFDGWDGKDSNSIESNPNFVSVPDTPNGWSITWDFNIESGSPAENAAGKLTISTNSGTDAINLEVADPYYFRDDYGISNFISTVKGDSIQIGSTSPVGIVSVNYSTGVLTLSSNRTWSVGDAIWLYKNGLKVNDIGVKQSNS